MRLLLTTALALSAAAFAQAQPKILPGGVVNSASYAAAGLPNGGIAQGSIFVIFGTGLGPATLQQVSAYPLANTLGGTSLSVTVNGTTTRPYMIYTSASQVAAILPSNTPVGTGAITVTYNGAASPAEPIRVAPASVGIFTSNQAGSGPGIITNTNFQLAGFSAAANPGEPYIIWGTGVGAVTGEESGPGIGVKLGTIPVEVLVGGKSASVINYARAGSASGLDQIAFTVPTGVTGCSVPVAVKIGQVVSNYVALAIAASGRTCSEPSGITPITVTQSGTVSIGSVDLSRSTISLSLPAPIGNVTTTTDSGSGYFSRSSYASYSSNASLFQLSTYGSCTVFTFKGSSPGAEGSAVNLDAGPSLAVNGPGGAKTLTKMSGTYSAQLGGGGFPVPGLPSTGTPLYLVKGTYTVTGTGGADVGPFTATLNVPDPLNWTNGPSISTVVRSNGQLITWTGGDPAGNVYIVGYSATGTGNNAVGAEFICVERTPVGQFTIPSAVLLSLPSSGGATGSGALLVEGTTLGTFKASGLDQATISSSSVTINTVTYQ